MAGFCSGFGSWLEFARMVGLRSAALRQGWERWMPSRPRVVEVYLFCDGIGKISGVVVGVIIFLQRDLFP